MSRTAPEIVSVVELLDVNVARRTQGVDYVELLKFTHRFGTTYALRIRIYTDTYPAQGYGIIEVWSRELCRWGELYSMAGVQLKAENTYYRHGTTQPVHFQLDRDFLLERGLKVLEV